MMDGRLEKKAGVLLMIVAGLTVSCCTTPKNKPPAGPDQTASIQIPRDIPVDTRIEPDPPCKIDTPPAGPLQITVQDAVLMALENNRSLAVERLTPLIRQTNEDQQRAVFDPVLGGEISYQQDNGGRQTETASDDFETKAWEASISLEEYFPTGTALTVQAGNRTTDSSLYPDVFTVSRLGVSITQALLRGAGKEVNLAALRQARLETLISAYELRGFSEALLVQVENAYWDYALAQRQIEIVEESLKLAKQQMAETEEMIQVGSVAESELPALQAEVAVQRQEYINAKNNLDATRLTLLHLLNPPGEDLWQREIDLVHPPALPEISLDAVETHVDLALRMRPEINQAKLKMQQGDLDIIRTKNGLLPRMDLFVTLGATGYADSFAGSVSDITSGYYDSQAGLTFELPVLNRAAKAQQRSALLTRDQMEKALDNLAQLVQLDVRTAYLEVSRTKEQIAASKATRNFQEEKLRIETEKFRVGRSTNFFVAQAQRDLLASRINEVQAVVNYLKALTGFFRMEGSLLVRRGIAAPGRDSVK